ncbi:MAG: FMN-binding protein [Syntrophomonadaceae bacterium]|jgi:electron transport complex protein RnfG
MRKWIITGIALLAIVLGLWVIGGRFQENSMTKAQLTVLNQILPGKVTQKQVQTIKLPGSTAQKFPAVDKMFKVAAQEESYVFLVSPVGYRSPVNTMVVVNAQKNEITGIKVIQHDETPGWGEWLTETWFADRFKGKSTDKYLERAILEAKKDNEIIQITSATISTQAVINGVNSAMGVYREVVLGQPSEGVPLKVQGFITEIQ